MKKLLVKYSPDSKTAFDVGHLADNAGRIYFEYDPAFISTGIELSPFFLPFKKGLAGHTDTGFGPMWGLFDDSLPDGWGLLLLSRFFKKQGISFSQMSPLDKLAWLGTRTMGALTYHPPAEMAEETARFIDLQQLAENATEIMEGSESEILPQLLKAGGSPGGARPKVLIGYNPESGSVLSGEAELPEGYEHWMVKFCSKGDMPESAGIEYAYSIMAQAAGIAIPETRLFSGNGVRFFGIKRFDRAAGNRRVHIHTFGNLIHADFRIPSVDYSELMKVARILTKDHGAVCEMFRRMVFNVFTHNRDDHVKNFSFLYDHEKRCWTNAPAYDLIYSEGPGGEHSMSVAGSGRNPEQADILKVATLSAITVKEADSIIEQVVSAVQRWSFFADNAGVTAAASKDIGSRFVF